MKTAGKSTPKIPSRQGLMPQRQKPWSLRVLPDKPGVYKFFDQKNNLLYVGKAKNLKKRVASYFKKEAPLAPDKQKMVAQIHHLDWQIVNNEREALLLEATLIKKYLPKFNIILKDDSNFLFLKINLAETFPTVSLVRQRLADKNLYFGPFTNAQNIRQFLKSIKTFLPIKTCSYKPERPCFENKLGRCAGHLGSPQASQDYQEILKNFILICRGQTNALAENFEHKMKQAAYIQNFELAKKYRDNLKQLRFFSEKQLAIGSLKDNLDVWQIIPTERGALATRLIIRNGKMLDANHLKITQSEGQNIADLYRALLSQFYATLDTYPSQIIVGAILPEITIKEFARIFKIKILTTKRGKSKKLLELALVNAQEAELRERPSWLKEQNATASLQKFLKLKKLPRRLECYDISNLAGKFPVGSLVVFINNLPSKKDYRHFAIDGFSDQNDPAMLSQMINRRLGHPEWPYPDLIILDGGRGQLAVVEKNWPKNIPKIPIIALAKKMEEIYLPQGKLRLDRRNPALKLLQKMRDEAHRFAITFNRQKRLKNLVK